jgi:hypothetical protein
VVAGASVVAASGPEKDKRWIGSLGGDLAVKEKVIERITNFKHLMWRKSVSKINIHPYITLYERRVRQ